MGGAQTKNTADLSSSVSNYVSQSTTTSNDQVFDVSNQMALNGCDVGGDVNYKAAATIVAKNRQISTAMQDSSVANTISQQLDQNASSTVGSLGIGFADASNSLSMSTKLTNKVSNAMQTSSNQAAYMNNEFICTGSSIGGTINVDFENNADFSSDQVASNKQVSDIENTISQTASQTATAKVQGLFAFLLILAFAIAIIGVTAAKAFSSGGMKVILIIILVFLIVTWFTWMYVASIPPLFDENKTCSPVDMNLTACGNTCVKIQYRETILKLPPTKYQYSLIEDEVNLLQMYISSIGNSSTQMGNNAGYHGAAWKKCSDTSTDSADGYTGLYWSDDVAEHRPADLPQAPSPLWLPCITDSSTPTYYKNNNKIYMITDEVTMGGSCTPGRTEWNFLPSSAVSGDNADSDNPCQNVDSDDHTLNLTSSPVSKENITDAHLAQLNYAAWSAYLNGYNTGPYTYAITKDSPEGDTLEARANRARFLFTANMKSVQNYVYVYDEEQVIVTVPPTGNKDQQTLIMTGAEAQYQYPDRVFRFTPLRAPINRQTPLTGGGTLGGYLGYCDDTDYKIHQAFNTWGLYVMIVLFVGVILFAVLFKGKEKDSPV